MIYYMCAPQFAYRSATSEWLSLGFGTGAGMDGADAVFGKAGSGVVAYKLGASNENNKLRYLKRSNYIFDASVTFDGTYTTVTFSRVMASTNSSDVEIVPGSSSQLICAL